MEHLLNRIKEIDIDIQRKRLVELLPALCILILLAITIFPSPSIAAVRHWEGGSDISGRARPSRTFYFPEGTTRNGFEEFLKLGNLDEETARVQVQCLFAAGEDPLINEYPVAGKSTLTISVVELVGRNRDLSLMVDSDREIVAERPIYFNYLGVWTGVHDSPGATSTSESWYFAEGCTRDGFHEWLCLQNPEGQIAHVELLYMLDGGETVVRALELAPHTRETVRVADHVGEGRDVSVLVSSDNPIAAERPMYFDYHNEIRGGHTLIGEQEAAESWYLAEGCTRDGFDEWLSVQNPGTSNRILVTYLYPDRPAARKWYDLSPRSRTTISVNEEAGPGLDVAVRIEADAPVVVERPMYFIYGEDSWEGGHTLAGLREGSRTWYLCGPPVGEGASTWLCLANIQDAEANAEVRASLGGSILYEWHLALPPLSRKTVDLGQCPGLPSECVIEVSAEEEVVVERPAYFSYTPREGSESFAFSTWDGLELMSPVPYHELTGIIFHEGAPLGGERANTPQVMQPLGLCLGDDNPAMIHPGVDLSLAGESSYWVEETRGRGSYSTTACDIMCKTGVEIYSPVSGTVIAAEGYYLYGKYPDLRAKIAQDGRPGYYVALLHLDSLSVSTGQRVEAGVTPIGTVRDLVPYFHSGPSPYTREEGNHVHLQVNYSP